MRGSVAEDYTYIVARLRAVEAALPEKAWFERLARAPEENILGSLREHYSAFEGVGSLLEFELPLAALRLEALELVTSLLAGERPRLLLRAGYDFDNVRHAWKAAKLGRTATGLTAFGLVPAAAVEEVFAGKASRGLPPHLERLVETLESVYEASRSLAASERAGESAKWRFLFETAPDARSIEYLRLKVDLANIKTFVRLRREPVRIEGSATAWCPGGRSSPPASRVSPASPSRSSSRFSRRPRIALSRRPGSRRTLPSGGWTPPSAARPWSCSARAGTGISTFHRCSTISSSGSGTKRFFAASWRER